MTYKVVEIFTSIEGEGKRAGQPAVFVRLHGCNLSCTYCDTTYAMTGEYETMHLDSIMDKLSATHIKRVTLTGGEPLDTPGVDVLIEKMLSGGFEVNVETNGSVDISPYLPYENLFFTIDYKLPSSGVCEKMHLANFPLLRPCDVLKFVVGNEHDAQHMLEFVRQLASNPQIYIGAVFGSYHPQDLVTFILDKPELTDAKIQLQLHKYIWNPSERGV